MTDQSRSGTSRFSGLGLAGLVFLLLMLAVWVSIYVIYGEVGKLDEAETTVVALVIAVLVFGARWGIGRLRRKPNTKAREGRR